MRFIEDLAHRCNMTVGRFIEEYISHCRMNAHGNRYDDLDKTQARMIEFSKVYLRTISKLTQLNTII